MTSNPLIRSYENNNETFVVDQPMSIQNVVNKSCILLLIAFFSGCGVWDICLKGFFDKVNILMYVGLIGGFILCMVTLFKPKTSYITAPIYALCEGLFLGAISFMYASLYNGIVIQAVGVTLAVMLAMLFLYKFRIIQATERFRSVVITSTFAIAIFYLVGLIGALFGHPMTIFNGGLLGIGVSLLICVIAALNFIIDFDSIERASNMMAPKYYEWYFATSIMVTLIWLYIEVLRLLAQLNSRR